MITVLHCNFVHIYRRKGQRYNDNCVLERNIFGGGSVMVWGGIMGCRKTDIVIINGNLDGHRYVAQILRPVLVHKMIMLACIRQESPANFCNETV